MKKRKTSTLRTAVMLAVLVVVAIGYFTQVGIGNISAFGWDVFSVICPLGYVESLLAGKAFVPRALISFVAVVALVIVLGRVFCGWVCPMPFLQKWMPGISRRAKKGTTKGTGASLDQAGSDEPCAQKPALTNGGKPNRFKLDSRFGVLLGALASAAVFGFPVFCLICPVGLTFATVFLVMRLFAFGDVTWTVVVVPAVLLVEVLFARKWCSKICPLGAVMSLISGANRTLRPTIDDNACLVSSKGANCYQCSASCPEQLDIRRPEASPRALSNCVKCRECADHCPASAITFPLIPKIEAAGKAASESSRPVGDTPSGDPDASGGSR